MRACVRGDGERCAEPPGKIGYAPVRILPDASNTSTDSTSGASSASRRAPAPTMPTAPETMSLISASLGFRGRRKTGCEELRSLLQPSARRECPVRQPPGAPMGNEFVRRRGSSRGARRPRPRSCSLHPEDARDNWCADCQRVLVSFAQLCERTDLRLQRRRSRGSSSNQEWTTAFDPLAEVTYAPAWRRERA